MELQLSRANMYKISNDEAHKIHIILLTNIISLSRST